jgi:hypothetical protein
MLKMMLENEDVNMAVFANQRRLAEKPFKKKQ